jgi:hypothetical protein
MTSERNRVLNQLLVCWSLTWVQSNSQARRNEVIYLPNVDNRLTRVSQEINARIDLKIVIWSEFEILTIQRGQDSHNEKTEKGTKMHLEISENIFESQIRKFQQNVRRFWAGSAIYMHPYRLLIPESPDWSVYTTWFWFIGVLDSVPCPDRLVHANRCIMCIAECFGTRFNAHEKLRMHRGILITMPISNPAKSTKITLGPILTFCKISRIPTARLHEGLRTTWTFLKPHCTPNIKNIQQTR